MYSITSETLNTIDPISGYSLAYKLASTAEGRKIITDLASNNVHITANTLNTVIQQEKNAGDSVAHQLVCSKEGQKILLSLCDIEVYMTAETLNSRTQQELFDGDSVAYRLSCTEEGRTILLFLCKNRIYITAATLNSVIQQRIDIEKVADYGESIVSRLACNEKGQKILRALSDANIYITEERFNFIKPVKQSSIEYSSRPYMRSIIMADGSKVVFDAWVNLAKIEEYENIFFSVSYRLWLTADGYHIIAALAKNNVYISDENFNKVCNFFPESAKCSLFFYILYNLEFKVDRFIERGGDISAITTEMFGGQSIITVAILSGNIKIINMLLAANQMIFKLDEPIIEQINTSDEIKDKLIEAFINMSVFDSKVLVHDKLEEMKYLVCLARKFYLHYGVDFPARHMSLLLAGHIDGFERNDIYVDSLNANEVEESIKSEDQEKFAGLMGQIKAKYLEEHQGDVLSQTENKPITTQFNISKNQEENSEPMVLPGKASTVKPR